MPKRPRPESSSRKDTRKHERRSGKAKKFAHAQSRREEAPDREQRRRGEAGQRRGNENFMRLLQQERLVASDLPDGDSDPEDAEIRRLEEKLGIRSSKTQSSKDEGDKAVSDARRPRSVG
jgi:hypothetical protein